MGDSGNERTNRTRALESVGLKLRIPQLDPGSLPPAARPSQAAEGGEPRLHVAHDGLHLTAPRKIPFGLGVRTEEPESCLDLSDLLRRAKGSREAAGKRQPPSPRDGAVQMVDERRTDVRHLENVEFPKRLGIDFQVSLPAGRDTPGETGDAPAPRPEIQEIAWCQPSSRRSGHSLRRCR